MNWLYLFAPLAFLVIEWFLGETSIVKPNSTIALVLDILKKILGIVKKPSA